MSAADLHRDLSLSDKSVCKPIRDEEDDDVVVFVVVVVVVAVLQVSPSLTTLTTTGE